RTISRVVIACLIVVEGKATCGGVSHTDRISKKRVITKGRIIVARGIVLERRPTCSSIAIGSGSCRQGWKTDSRITRPGRVTEERSRADRNIEAPGGIAIESESSIRRVLAAGVIKL